MKVHSGSIKKFPGCPKEVPDSLLSEEWAQRNHGQSLKRLNERGGMDVSEILDNIKKRKWSISETTQADVNELVVILQDQPSPAINEGVKEDQERKFTLQEMMDCYKSGFQAASPDDWNESLNGDFMRNYFKQLFGITIKG